MIYAPNKSIIPEIISAAARKYIRKLGSPSILKIKRKATIPCIAPKNMSSEFIIDKLL